MTALHALLAEHAQEAGQVVVGIETDRGPWVAALIGAGYRVYAINPRVAALYRKRHQIGGGKSDRGDARMLANLVRTDSRNHRPVAGDSALASAVQVRARAQQQLVWNRTREGNRLCSALLQYFPAALQAFPDLRRACWGDNSNRLAAFAARRYIHLGQRRELPLLRCEAQRLSRLPGTHSMTQQDDPL